MESLEHACLITRKGLMRHALATDAARVNQRWRRVLPLIRSVAELAADDADLLVGLAAAGALRLTTDDHLRAHHRIGSLGNKRPTRFIELVYECFNARTGSALAEALLPPQLSFKPGDFDPGETAGLLPVYACP